MKCKQSIPLYMNALCNMRSVSENKMIIKKVLAPIPEDNELLIKTVACGINWSDIEQFNGVSPLYYLSDILGIEISGIVLYKGKNVNQFKIGDRVMAIVSGGGFAEYSIAHQELCFKLPNNIDLISAAAVPLACFTIYRNIYQLAQLTCRDKILIHGGTGSLGSTLIQIASHFGHTIYTTCGTNDKCNIAKSLGATYAFNYRRECFYDEIIRKSNDQGVDLILDYIGSDYLDKHINLLNRGGRLILLNSRIDYVRNINLSHVIMKNISILGSMLHPLGTADKALIASGVRKEILPLLYKFIYSPLVSRIFQIFEFDMAYKYMLARNHIGKVILQIAN